MKILVTGASGMLGFHVSREVVSRYGEESILKPLSTELDIGSQDSVTRYFHKYDPDVIINCAGRVPIKNPCSSYDVSMAKANALGPHLLAPYAKRMIHMSTDCVFSGLVSRRYFSDEIPDPNTLYGQTKLVGEVNVSRVINVRGSFIGWESGLLSWLKKQSGKIDGWTGVFWNGTSVSHMARVLCDFIESDRTGVVHVAGDDFNTKYWYLRILSERLNFPVQVKPISEPRIFRVLAPDISVPSGHEIIKELVESYT